MKSNDYLRIVRSLFNSPLSKEQRYTKVELDEIESKSNYRLPKALREFYLGIGTFDTILRACNRFYGPDDIVRMDDKLVFCEENQAVVYWGIDFAYQSEADPPVYQGINCEPMEWHIEAKSCSEFLTGMVYWQAVNGGLPMVRYSTTSPAIRRKLRTHSLVWKDADSQLLTDQKSVVCLTRRDKRKVEVQAASMSDMELDILAERIGVEWIA